MKNIKKQFLPVQQIKTLTLITLGLTIFIITSVVVSRSNPLVYIHNDFYDYWIGSALFWKGISPYGITNEFKSLKETYNLQFHWATGYSYPPFLAWIFYPLIHMNPVVSAWIWFFMNILIYGAFCYWVSKRNSSILLPIYLLTFSPALYSIGAGQINIWILVALYFYISRPNSWIGVLGLSFSGIIKVYPFFLNVFQGIQKQWKTLIYMIGVSIAFIALPSVPFGLSTTIEYVFSVLPKLQNSTEGYFAYQSFNSFLFRLSPHVPIVQIHQFFTVSMILFLIYLSFKIRNHWHMISLWITGLILVAGTTTFWNFTPTLLGNIYVIDRWNTLSKSQRTWFIFSIVCSNLLWHFTYFFNKTEMPQHVLLRIPYAIAMSVGFFYGIIQFILLTTIKDKRENGAV